MKRGFTFLFCFLAGLTVFSQAGRPYAIWEDQSLGVYRYVRLDASSGSKTNISVIPGIAGFVAGNATAYNSVTDQYHFTAVNGSGQLIFYTLGRITGAIIYNPFLQHNLVGIEYNPADSLLYALRINTTTYDIVTLDPATGADTLVISCGNFTGYVAGSFCLNTQLQHYSFIVLNASTYFLRTFDLATGLMIANNSFPDNVVGHRYSCLDNAVYGLWEVNNVYTLEQIDQLSGAHTTVDTLASVTPGFVTESYSVNTTGNYTFRGFDAGNNFALFTIDLANAAIIASASTNDNAVGFEEPGFCAGTTLVNNLHEEYLKNIFPVPATDKLFIRTTSKKIKKINISDLQGQTFFSENTEELTADLYSADVSQLKAGMYFVNIVFEDENSCIRKIIKQ